MKSWGQNQCPLTNTAYNDIRKSAEALGKILEVYSKNSRCKELKDQSTDLSNQIATAADQIYKYNKSKEAGDSQANQKSDPKSPPASKEYDPKDLTKLISSMSELTTQLKSCQGPESEKYPVYQSIIQTMTNLNPFLIIYGGSHGVTIAAINTLAKAVGDTVVAALSSAKTHEMTDPKERSIFIESSCAFLEFEKSVESLYFLDKSIRDSKSLIAQLEEKLRQINSSSPPPVSNQYQRDVQNYEYLNYLNQTMISINNQISKKSEEDKNKFLCFYLSQTNTNTKKSQAQYLQENGQNVLKLFNSYMAPQLSVDVQNGLFPMNLVNNNYIASQFAESNTQIFPLNPAACSKSYINWSNNLIALIEVINGLINSDGSLDKAYQDLNAFNNIRKNIKNAIDLETQKVDRLKLFDVQGENSQVDISEISATLGKFRDLLFKSESGLITTASAPAMKWLTQKMILASEKIKVIGASLDSYSRALDFLKNQSSQKPSPDDLPKIIENNKSACLTLKEAYLNLKETEAHLGAARVYCNSFKNSISNYSDVSSFCYSHDDNSLISKSKNISSVNSEFKKYESKISIYREALNSWKCDGSLPN